MEFYNFKLDSSKFTLTPEGFLDCVGACARIGNQTYSEDGKPFIEFRPEDEVFSKASLDSHKLKPITIRHPEALVDSDNFQMLNVGVTGYDPRRDGDFLLNDFRIMDKSAVEGILARRDRGESTEISMGYDRVLDKKNGEFRGKKYDGIQRNIRINHAALLDEGQARAGSGAKLILDNERDKTMHVLKRIITIVGSFTSDSIEGEYGKESKSLVDGLCLRLDRAIERIKEVGADFAALKSDKDKLQAQADESEKENKKLSVDVKELSDVNSDRVQKMISDRGELEAVAGCFKIDCKGKTSSDIRDAVIQADDKDFKLDGRSDEYKKARFDLLSERVKRDAKAFDSSKQSFGEFRKNVQDSKGTEKKDARKEFKEKSADAYKGKEYIDKKYNS